MNIRIRATHSVVTPHSIDFSEDSFGRAKDSKHVQQWLRHAFYWIGKTAPPSVLAHQPGTLLNNLVTTALL